MIAVLDTSAAIEVVLNRARASRFRKILSEADWVLALDLFIPEITNIFLKYHQFERLSLDVCEDSLDRAIDLVDTFESPADLYREALALSCQTNRSVYDSMVLILARRKNAVLLTADEKLQALAKELSIKTL
ncbi:MAG: type II toxin-antitoxin system VapC family toxin [Anaerolineae bacterium]|nr:type II toxin-antitoxin system VapC family toxin [Anaerolineae bacterium]